jgi:acyl-CoA synthetase (NDP forming)
MTDRLSRLIRPESVALWGATERGPGGAVARNLLSFYRGRTYFVNPNREELMSKPVFASGKHLPEVVDTAILAVGPTNVLGAMEEAASCGIRNFIVLAAGFGETDAAEGKSREDALRQLADRLNLTVCGPNCLGVISAIDSAYSFSLDMTGVGELPRGHVAIVAQSGGLLISVLAAFRDRDLAFSYVISSGAESVIGVAEYLRWLANDEHTKVVGLLLEGVGDGQEFLNAANECIRQGKPVVAIKIGRSAQGTAAVLAHTGKIAGSARVFDEVCRQHGVLVVDGLSEFGETLLALSKSARLPTGPRLGAAMISGGAAVLLSDLCEGSELELPEITDDVITTLKGLLPAHAIAKNPLDITGGSALSSPEVVIAALEVFESSGVFDMLAFVYPASPRDGSEAEERLLEHLIKFGERSALPFFLIAPNSGAWNRRWLPVLRSSSTVALQDLRVAVSVLGLAAGVENVRLAAKTRPLIPSRSKRLGSLAPASDSRVLGSAQARRLMLHYGVPVAQEAVLVIPEDVVAIGSRLRYPVALKVISPSVPHKTEAGAIRLGLVDAEALGAAWNTFQVRAQEHRWSAVSYVVQEMIPHSVELIVGLVRDPVFGMVLVFGPGGTLVELMPHATRIAKPPLTDRDVDDLLRTDPVSSLLAGYRGEVPADVTGLKALLMAMSDLAIQHPEIVSLDLNPVVVDRRGGRVVALDVLVEVDNLT